MERNLITAKEINEVDLTVSNLIWHMRMIETTAHKKFVQKNST